MSDAHRMTHPDNPAHEIHVLDEHVERYASQGWRFVEALAAEDDGSRLIDSHTSATDGDD